MHAQMQRATAQGQPARWGFAKVVGGYKVAVDCMVGKVNRKGKMVFNNLASTHQGRGETREVILFRPREGRAQTKLGHGLRKAVSLGHI